MTIKTTRFRRIGAHGVAGLLAVMLVSVGCGGGSGGSTGTAGGSGHAGGAGTTGSAGKAGGGTTGSAGTTGAGGAADNTPVGLCKQLVSTLCTRSNTCNAGGDGGPIDVSQCITLENVEFGCDRATSTAFPPCLSDVEGLSCAGLFTANGLQLPGSCNDPLDAIPLSDAQMKCLQLTEVICQKIAACQGVTSPTADDLMNCEQDLASSSDGIGCDFAVSVSATYAQCLTDVPNAMCVNDDAGDDASIPGDVPSCDSVIIGPM